MRSGEGGNAEVEPLTNYFVGRSSRAFRAGQSSAGAMLTAVNRDFRDDVAADRMPASAYTAGVDFLHEWRNREWSVSGSLSGSAIDGTARAMSFAQRAAARYFQRPDADHLEPDSTATSMRGYSVRLEARRRAGFI